MALLAAGAARAEVWAALIVAATIGAYTLSDSHAAREYGDNYIFATQAASGLMLIARGRDDGARARPRRIPVDRVETDDGRGGDDDRSPTGSC